MTHPDQEPADQRGILEAAPTGLNSPLPPVVPETSPPHAAVAVTVEGIQGVLDSSADHPEDGQVVLQALSVLRETGFAATFVSRDQRGVRVRGVVNGHSTTRWYSFDECARLVERHAAETAASVEAVPEPVEEPRRKRSLMPLGLMAAGVIGPLMLGMFLIRGLPPEAIELTVVQPTAAYSGDGQVLWTAGRGEHYRVVGQDATWIVVATESPGPPRARGTARFVKGSSVSLASDRPAYQQLVAQLAGRFGIVI